MIDKNKTIIQIQDNFTLMAMFVRDLATLEQVEIINNMISPLNQAILQRLKPTGTAEN